MSTLTDVPATVVVTVAPPSGVDERELPLTTTPEMPPCAAPSETVDSMRLSPPLTVSVNVLVW